MKESIKKIGLEMGFARVGITTAEPVEGLDYIEESISAGRNAEMRWLARSPRRRVDPSSLLSGARSVICCALAYDDHGCHSDLREELSPLDGEVDLSRIARYARGDDYHNVIREKLKEFWDEIKNKYSDAKAKLCVDTSPILEKALAERAGIGWIGKHTILLNEELGSWFMLGEIITDVELEPDLPSENRCGDCTACMDGCPTSAIIAPNVLDARRCISYLTIEEPRISSNDSNRQSLITNHKYSYGCDLCQEVCPYNIHSNKG